MVLFFKKEPLASSFAYAGFVVLWMLAGCASGVPAKPDVVGFVRRVARIADLTDYADVASDIGVPYELSVQYYTDAKGEQKRNVVSLIANKPVPDVAGVTVVSYEVQMAGGPAARVPDGDPHVAQARIVFAMSGKDDCVTRADLRQVFGAAAQSAPVADGWGLSDVWQVRDGRRFRTTLEATFGTTTDQCASSLLVHQVRRVG